MVLQAKRTADRTIHVLLHWILPNVDDDEAQVGKRPHHKHDEERRGEGVKDPGGGRLEQGPVARDDVRQAVMWDRPAQGEKRQVRARAEVAVAIAPTASSPRFVDVELRVDWTRP